MDIQLSVPKTSMVDNSYTVYHILVKLPLRQYALMKRYSDFDKLILSMEAETGNKFPFEMPPKTRFYQKKDDPDIIEARRSKFEEILSKIVTDSGVWKQCTSFGEFLELPPGVFQSEKNGVSNKSMYAMASSNEPILDVGIWLDTVRECRKLLQNARSNVNNQQQVRKYLMIVKSRFDPLSQGLSFHESNKGSTFSEMLGEGEIRRRKDLLSSLRSEYSKIEGLLTANNTIPGSFDTSDTDSNDSGSLFGKSRRVLGRTLEETNETRELNDTDLLQQQQLKLKKQDQELDYLTAAIRKQKMMGITISQELEYQNELLEDLDHAVDKTGTKLRYASKKTGKINH